MASIIEGIAKDIKNIPKTIKGKTKSLELKKVILKVLPYVIFGLINLQTYIRDTMQALMGVWMLMN